jgi:hypothetical protein
MSIRNEPAVAAVPNGRSEVAEGMTRKLLPPVGGCRASE